MIDKSLLDSEFAFELNAEVNGDSDEKKCKRDVWRVSVWKKYYIN